MTNSVTFYKVPWTNSSLNQPYFMTESDRDSYLQDNCYPFVVLQNVNINLLTDMNVELKVPIDITVAQEYNFCKIEYNEKKYFACIIDYSQISVNRTYIYAKRHILTEIVNYLFNFENFNISTATLNDSLIYKKNAKFYKPEFRSYKKYIDLDIALNRAEQTNGQKQYVSYDCTYEQFLFVYHTYGDGPDLFYGRPYNVRVYAVPLKAMFGSISVNYCQLYRNVPQTNSNYSITFSNIYKNVYKYVETLSPYIISYKVVNFPVGRNSNHEICLPYYWITQNTVDESGTVEIGFQLRGTGGYLSDVCDSFYSTYFSCTTTYGNLEIRGLNSDARIIIDKSDYCDNNQKSFNIRIYYIMSVDDDETMIILSQTANESVSNDNGISLNTAVLKNFFEVGGNVAYRISSEADFNSQNRYYDAMTKSVRNQKIAGAWVQGVQNIAIGATEVGMAMASGGVATSKRQIVMPSNTKRGYSKVTLNSEYNRPPNLAGKSLGIGNIIRGVGSIVDGYIDAHFYEEQREIFAKNEKAKPDEVVCGGGGDGRYFDSLHCFYLIEEIPFENDYEIWQQNVERFGISCEIFSNEIDLNDYIKNNHFVIQAVAEMKSTALLNCVEYDALYDVLTGGCRYFIVGTVSSSNSNLLEKEVSNES